MNEKNMFEPNFERKKLIEKIKDYIIENKVEINDPATVMESLAEEVEENKGKYTVRGDGSLFKIYFFDKDNSFNECEINLNELNCNRGEFDENMLKIGFSEGSDILNELAEDVEYYLNLANE